MTATTRGLLRLNVSLANSLLFKSNFINAGIRTLYTDNDLGVVSYENARFMFRNQFVTIEDTFRSKMNEICEREDGIVYTEDLKAMLHLAQENDADMTLLSKMLEKYIKTKHERKYGSYAFGPVVMRMYYYLNQPRLALSMFENPTLSDNFNYHASFRVLMCLLYKHNMYKEMREVYDKYLNEQGIEFIGRNSVLVYAACLKENTPESLEYALQHWRSQFGVIKPTVRSCAMVSLLAIKNNAAEVALEILAIVDRERAISIRCLKMLAYMNLQRYLQIIPLLKHAVEQDDTGTQRQNYFADVMYELEEHLKGQDVPERSELQSLIEKMKQQELLETHITLEEFLLRPMSIVKKSPFKTGTKDGRFVNNRPRSHQRQSRVGLQSYL